MGKKLLISSHHLILAFPMATLLFSSGVFAACPANTQAVQFAWEDAASNGAIWQYGDTSNVYTLNYTNASGNPDSVQVTVSLRDPDNINVDPDVRDAGKHPYDPQGSCNPSTGETKDDWAGNGSIQDPWDSDCNGDPSKLSTGTNKAYGLPYFTWVLLSSHHDQTAYLDFKFSKPVYMDNFTVGDIDAAGLLYTYNNFVNYEAPGNSYQDEVGFAAANNGTDVPVSLFNQGSGLIVGGNIVRSHYDSNQNYNVAPDDAVATVSASTVQPFDTFTLSYSNGQDDANDEQANPNLYTWWSGTHGATNGASDNHAVRFSGFTFCAAEAPKADISLAKSVDKASAKSGDTVVYTLVATNAAGSAAATGVEIKDQLPTGVVYQTSSGDGTYTPGTGVWAVGDLASGASESLSITVTVK